MSKKIARVQRAAMTLMELLVVIAILALLAMIAVPKLVDAYERSRSGVQGYGLAEASRSVENYFGTYRAYPQGIDTLLEGASGAATATKVYSKMHANVAPWLKVTDLKSETNVLEALRNVGVSHVFMHDSAATVPSDSGTNRTHILFGHGTPPAAELTTLVTLDTTNASVQNILLKDFNVNQNGDAAGDITFLGKYHFVVFGMGPRNTMVGTVHQNAPIYESAKPDSNYARGLMIFMIPNSTNSAPATALTKARFVGVIGPDGRSLQDSVQDYNLGNVPH